MTNYIGVHCPVCEKRFAEGDDIVVCPICGAPHHRACYQELGHCKLQDQHITGRAWEAPHVNRAQDPSAGPEIVCPSCGAYNPQSGIFCQICGARLGRPAGPADVSGAGGAYQTADSARRQYRYGQEAEKSASPQGPGVFTMAFGGLAPDEELDGVSVRDLAIYVGDNSQYFLPRFKLCSERVGFTPNFAALFFNFFYFFYRKMFLFGGILLFVALLTQLPGLLLMPEWAPYLAANFKDLLMGVDIMAAFQPQNMTWVLRLTPFLRSLSLVTALGFSMFSNRLYYFQAVRAIKKAKARFSADPAGFNDQAYAALLAKKGRTSQLAVVLCCAAVVAFYFLVSLIFMLPYMGDMVGMMEQVLQSAA